MRIYIRKGRPVHLALPDIKAASDLVTGQGILIQALAEGAVTAEEAASVSSILEAHRRAIETAELEERLHRLEQTLGAGR